MSETCGNCRYAHAMHPHELRLLTCYGMPPQIVMITQQKMVPNPDNPNAPPRMAMEQRPTPLRPQIMVGEFACSRFAPKENGARIAPEIDETPALPGEGIS
jgi:hypothetical protein